MNAGAEPSRITIQGPITVPRSPKQGAQMPRELDGIRLHEYDVTATVKFTIRITKVWNAQAAADYVKFIIHHCLRAVTEDIDIQVEIR